jgi:hypothetical protein
MIKAKVIGLLVAGFMVAAASAQAAVLSVVGGDNTQTLDAVFSLSATTGLASGAPLVTFNAANAGGGGLFLTGGPTKLSFEYLGSAAAYTNAFNALGGTTIFGNTVTPVGTKTSATVPNGLVDFFFTTDGGGDFPGSARNGGPISQTLSIAFAGITDKSVIVLFDDGAHIDYHDLAVRVGVSQVPLPAAAWLLFSAVLGLVSFARIRRKEAPAA